MLLLILKEITDRPLLSSVFQHFLHKIGKFSKIIITPQMIKNILNGHLTGCTYPDASSLDGGLDMDHLLLPKPAFWSSTLTLRPNPASQSLLPNARSAPSGE